MSEYSKIEEKVNVYSHGVGAILSLVALILLILKTLGNYNFQASLSFILFGVSLIVLYFCSALYHSTIEPKLRFKRKVFDHCAIYILIAGTYAPYALAALGGKLGWLIFASSWFIALVGISLKLYFTGRFKILSTLMYVLMGWMVLFFIKPLRFAVSEEALSWLVLGGLAYSFGALIYLIKKIKLNHGIFHLFVLIGSLCHFISIYYYL